MGRRRRDLTESTWFHVNNRGADRQDIFSEDRDHLLFESLLGTAATRFGVEVHSYALMSNHFHLLVNCPEGGLSEMMQSLCGRYGAAYNSHTERQGPVLGGRFHSVPVIDDGQLQQTARYIHRNPLAFVPLNALASYRWSSLGVLLERRPRPDWLVTGVVRPDQVTVDAYLDFILTPQPSDVVAEALTGPRSIGTHDVDDAVAKVAGRDAADIQSPTPGRSNIERDLAVTLAVELRVAPAATLAANYGLADQSSLRRIARRGRVRLVNDAVFARARLDALRYLMATATPPFGVGSGKAGLE